MRADDMDAVFAALAHPDRRRIMDLLKAQPGCTVGDVAGTFSTSRIAVMKHLRVLEEAGLLTSQREGRMRRLYHNPVPIQMIYDRWTTEYSALWAAHLTGVKYKVESKGAAKPKAGRGERSTGGKKPKG